LNQKLQKGLFFQHFYPNVKQNFLTRLLLFLIPICYQRMINIPTPPPQNTREPFKDDLSTRSYIFRQYCRGKPLCLPLQQDNHRGLPLQNIKKFADRYLFCQRCYDKKLELSGRWCRLLGMQRL